MNFIKSLFSDSSSKRMEKLLFDLVDSYSSETILKKKAFGHGVNMCNSIIIKKYGSIERYVNSGQSNITRETQRLSDWSAKVKTGTCPHTACGIFLFANWLVFL